MTHEEKVAEDVAKRMEGLKKFTAYARETIYSSKVVWAKDYNEAEDKFNDMDWLNDDIDSSDHFEVYKIEEEEL